MSIGTYKKQIEKPLQVKDENLIYYGIVLCGEMKGISYE